MQLSSASVSSNRGNLQHRSGSRLRKKHKRLDAICEEEYNRNHVECNESNGSTGPASGLSELRRSSRVRRAPEVLDASPPPAKKRKKLHRNVNLAVNLNAKSRFTPVKKDESDSMGESETPGGWGSRLRSRGRKSDFEAKAEIGGTSRRRKLFQEIDQSNEEEVMVSEEVEPKREGLGVGTMMVVKSKRPGRIKALNGSKDEREKVEPCSLAEESETHEVNVTENKAEVSVPESRSDSGNDRETANDDVVKLDGEEGSESLDSLQLEDCIDDDTVDRIEHDDEKDGEEVEEGGIDAENRQDVEEVMDLTKQEAGENHDCNVNLVEFNGKPLQVENTSKLDEANNLSTNTFGRIHIKQGRRCGLCGGGTDGKPPKRLVQDTGDSDNEAHSASSASEEPNYDVWDGFGDESGWLGRLLGPINDRYGIAGIWVHQQCAVWSPEVYFAGLGCLKNVRAALCRGRALKCTRCARPGATIGCRVDRCPKTYHLPCARANGCIFDHRKFLIACTDHRHLFQPYGNQYLARIKKMKARKMKLELRKLTNEASRKDIEAEEKWLENCGEDEEFLKRESRRLHRDLLRIAPVYIGGSDSESGKAFEGWESVAGLQDVIQCMKEVVILPLLYPEFFDNLGLTPPRGVLLHGYPGTGKTLVVRALIGSCASGDKRIAYFARKGADCLGKYVGDAERQLRLLFQVAERCQPSIIFFDEIDGLAPCRTRHQDQTHSSVVSTLLALMDGLKSRGSVVVIGATNRPEAVDPALRRPGRFDREIYFPLPSVEDRAAILSLHTRRWPRPIAGSLLNWIAKRTVGFAGADLQALCTQAAMIALKRNVPLQQILSAAGKKAHDTRRAPLPAFEVKERDWLEALSCSPPPCSRREAGTAAFDLVSSPLPTHLIPCLLQPLISLVVSLHLDECLWLPLPLLLAAEVVKSVIISALDKRKQPSDCWGSCVDALLPEPDVANEVEDRLSYVGLLSGKATIVDSDACSDTDNFDISRVHNAGVHTSVLQNIGYSSRKKPGFRILVAGSPKSGQRHLAACLLHCFVGNIQIQKVDLATISQEGDGDLACGITRILMKCSNVRSSVMFMPRIDLWAVETLQQVMEKSDSFSPNEQSPKNIESFMSHGKAVRSEDPSCPQQLKSAETKEHQSASHAWSSFVEQVESLCMSTSLIVLATAEVPSSELPLRIRQFFESRMSSCGQSTPFEHSVPRFSVQLGRNFSCDMVINASAVQLSRDIVQLFLQLIHQRTHAPKSSYMEFKTCDSIEGCTDTVVCGVDNNLVNEHEAKTEPSHDLFMKAPLPPNNKSLKGKSSLLLAISTFGYQILRFPHFAELCWVTSKLKDGPSADISGPWKGWPFNSCIIRPSDSVDKVAVACNSGNTKSKERFRLVRGLIAVGLSAYRGMYASIREVSFEVRKVLELLVEKINAKVQSGKDRYQYVRVLSQVAYLEDVVNNWAYALQSLEVDAQMNAINPNLSTLTSSDNRHAHLGKSVPCDEFKSNVPERSYREPQGMEEHAQGFAVEKTGLVDLNNEAIGPNFEREVPLSEEGWEQQMVLSSPLIPDKISHNFVVADQLVEEKRTNEENGTNTGSLISQNIENVAVLGGHSVSWKHSSGFISTESVVCSENGVCSSGELDGAEVSVSRKSCNQISSLSLVEITVASKNVVPDPSGHSLNINMSSSRASGLVTDSGIVCMYRLCPQCLCILHGLMRRILTHEWGTNRSHVTAEDVHDLVSSLSTDLLSAIRKVHVDGSISKSAAKTLRDENYQKVSEHVKLNTCDCKSSGNSLLVAMDCTCHLTGGCTSEEATIPVTDLGFDAKFVFRDGVLVPVDSEKDVPFHCKFQTLCLCSLIKLIAMTKKLFD